MKLIILEGTQEELAPFIQGIQLGDHAKSISTLVNRYKENEEKHPTKPVRKIWSETAMEKFVNYIWGNQVMLIKYLISKGGRAHQMEIMKHLGFKKGQQLAGVLSGITRNAISATNHEQAKFIDYEWVAGSEDYEYFVVSEAMEVIQKLKPSQLYK